MKQPLRVAVADDEPIMQMYLEETLSEFGHDVVAAAKDGVDLLEQCRASHPDLVVTDIKMPRLDGLRAVQQICRHCPVPVVFITGYDEWEQTLQAESQCVLVYLMKPVGEADLRGAIDLVMQRFEQFKVLLEEEPDLHKALDNRIQIEKAKSLLARREGITDQQAFDHLRQRAAENHQTLIEAATEVLNTTKPNRRPPNEPPITNQQ